MCTINLLPALDTDDGGETVAKPPLFSRFSASTSSPGSRAPKKFPKFNFAPGRRRHFSPGPFSIAQRIWRKNSVMRERLSSPHPRREGRRGEEEC